MEHEPRLPLSVSENAAEDAVSEDKALSIFEDERRAITRRPTGTRT
jgi:hypothetical protein